MQTPTFELDKQLRESIRIFERHLKAGFKIRDCHGLGPHAGAGELARRLKTHEQLKGRAKYSMSALRASLAAKKS